MDRFRMEQRHIVAYWFNKFHENCHFSFTRIIWVLLIFFHRLYNMKNSKFVKQTQNCWCSFKYLMPLIPMHMAYTAKIQCTGFQVYHLHKNSKDEHLPRGSCVAADHNIVSYHFIHLQGTEGEVAHPFSILSIHCYVLKMPLYKNLHFIAFVGFFSNIY